MHGRVNRVVVGFVVVLMSLVAVEAQAARTTPRTRCFAAIAKAATRYVKGRVTLERSCREASLRAGCGTCTGGGNAGEPCSQTSDCPDDGPGTVCAGVVCPAPDAAAIAKLEGNFASALTRRCDLGTSGLASLGFPGPCEDANPGDGFTLDDLVTCLRDSHTALLHGVCAGGSNATQVCRGPSDCPGAGARCVGLFGVEYDSAVCGDLSADALACQREIGRSSLRFLLRVLTSVQRCRNDLLTGKLSPIDPALCATDDPKTRDAIAAARARAAAHIAAKCDAASATTLAACTPDQTTATGPDCTPSVAGCNACVGAVPCETCWHQALADDPLPGDGFDFIDYEYPPPPTCGDNRVNQHSEECDGASDAACPAQCGSPSGFFPCLCQDRPRQRVVEHLNADLDLGWTGLTHDLHVVEGGGFVSDLWDCDGPSGPDTLCTVGPSCSGGSHSPCSPEANQPITGDSICQTLGEGTCRRTAAGSVGRHCELDPDQRCVDFGDCPGDRCVESFHGAPLPLSAGGISVCSVNIFTEDVTGTTDVVTGSSAIRLRQRSLVYGPGDAAQPCPVCGGFCEGIPGTLDPGHRTVCTGDAECPNEPHHCVTASVCSFGPNQDQPCRRDPPFGGTTSVFGNPSVDCLPPPGINISGGGIDIVFDQATTATVTRTASQHCTTSPFQTKACIGGSADGRPCTAGSECPLGVCNEQCFCPGQPRPNACLSACVGGAQDAQSCDLDADCPGGFCHPGDCRVDPLDPDSLQEGICTAGPINGHCTVKTYQSCRNDGECRPPICPACGGSETCVLTNRACFVNGTIERRGAAGVPDATTAAIFCLPAVSSPTVNITSGLPGPGALTQPITTIEVGF